MPIQRIFILSTLSAMLCSASALAQQGTAPAQQATAPAAAAPAASPAPAQPAPAAAAAATEPSAAVAAAAPAPPRKLETVAALKQALGATDTARGTVVDLPADTVFDFNQAGVRIEAAALLQNLADLLRKTGKPVLLTGHTDNKGNAEYDKKLSEMRAKALKGALVQRGIRAGSIKTAGAGQERPKAANANPDGSDNPKGREANRRIEVLIAKR